MKSKFFHVVFYTILLITFYGIISHGCSPVRAQGRGDKAPATQSLRDSSITLILIAPSLRDTLVFQSASGYAPIADSALTLRTNTLVLAHLKTTAYDSLIKLVVDSSDYARFLRNNAISNRSPFASIAFDSLQNYWVIHCDSADYATRSGRSDSSGYADAAHSSIKYIGTDPVAEATHADIADYADVAGSAVSFYGYFTPTQWDSIIDTVAAVAGALDTVDFAYEADSTAELHDNAVDRLAAFSSSMQSSYLPTANQKSALGASQHALTGTNYVMDRTGAYRNFIWNKDTASSASRSDSFTIGVSTGAFAKIGLRPTMIFDTTTADSGFFKFFHGPTSNVWLFPDSNMVGDRVDRKILSFDDTLVAYIRNGAGYLPTMVHNVAGVPSPGTGVTGDWAMNTTAKTIYIKTGASTWELVAGGGGGVDSVTSFMYGASVIPTDSLAPRGRDNIWYGDNEFQGELSVSSGQMKVGLAAIDTVAGLGDKTVVIDSILFVKNIGSSTINGDAWFDDLTVQDVCSTKANLIAENIYPATTGTYYIGHRGSSLLYNQISAGKFYAVDGAPLVTVRTNGTSSDSVTITGSGGISSIGLPVSVVSDNLTVTNGTIQQTGTGEINGVTISAASGPYMNSTALYVNTTGDYIQGYHDTIATIKYGSGTPIFSLSADEKQSVLATCPDPTSANPLITKQWMKEFISGYLFKDADSLVRKNPRLNIFYKHPDCNDTISWGLTPMPYLPGHNRPVEIPQGWNGGTPIDQDSGRLVQIIQPWINPGWPIGPYWIDSTAGTISSVDPGPGIGEHEFQVSERFYGDDSYFTGKFQTLKQALDSLPNFRCRLWTTVGAASAGNPDTFQVKTQGLNAYRYAMLSFYRGKTEVMDSIHEVLPPFLLEPGVWVKFAKSSDTEQRWAQILEWVNDSTFTVDDSVLNGQFPDAIDSLWTLTFAKKAIIEVFPPVNGGFVELASAAYIHDVCPVHIKGLSKDEVVITNDAKFDTLFKVDGTGVDNVYTGMPIEFSNMTLLYDTLTGGTSSPLVLSGNVNMRDMNIAARSINVNSRGFLLLNYASTVTVRGAEPSVVFENVTMVADADVVCVSLYQDSSSFQSYNCVYSIGGDSGRVMKAWADEVYTPSFNADIFYVWKTGAKVVGSHVAQTTNKALATQCTFINIDGVTSDGSAACAGGYTAFYPTTSNSYAAAVTQPPAKLRSGSLPVKVRYAPK